MRIKPILIPVILCFCLASCTKMEEKATPVTDNNFEIHKSEDRNQPNEGENQSKEKELNDAIEGTNRYFLEIYLKGTDKNSYDSADYTDVVSQKYQIPVLESSSAERYPNLAKTLAEYEKAYVMERESFYNEAIENYTKFGRGDDYFQASSENNLISVGRADDKILSLIYNHDSFGGGAHGYYGTFSVAFDTESGKKLSFDDIVLDKDKFFQIVDKKLQEQYSDVYQDLTPLDEFRTSAKEYNQEYSWSIDYEGVTIYFNPYDLAYYAAGSQVVTIGFGEAPDLFPKEYQEKPDTYIIPLSTWQEIYLDADGDGDTEKLAVQLKYDEEYQDYTGVEIKLDNKTLTLDNWSFKNDNYIINNNESYYLYCFQTVENDYSILNSIDLKTFSYNEEGVGLSAANNYFDYSEKEEDGVLAHTSDYLVCPLIDPSNMKLSSHSDMLGTRLISGTYSAQGELLLPVIKDNIYLGGGGQILKAKQDVSCMMVDEKGNEVGKANIPKGSYLFFARTDNNSFVDFQFINPADVIKEGEGDYIYYHTGVIYNYDPKGETYRVYVDKNGDYMGKINGNSEEEMFEGIIYAG